MDDRYTAGISPLVLPVSEYSRTTTRSGIREEDEGEEEENEASGQS